MNASAATSRELPVGLVIDAERLAETVAATLAAAGVESPSADARWLIEGLLGVDPRRHPNAEVVVDERFAVGLGERVARRPLQLIVGSTAFLDLTIACRAGVFVPRPETEVLAQLAIDEARQRTRPVVVEPFTGTGAIACAVARHVSDATVIAIDADAAAVGLARDNLAAVCPERVAVDSVAVDSVAVASVAVGSVAVAEGDLFAPLPSQLIGRVDVVVANPPYLPAAEATTWLPEVADHDPYGALVGGEDGNEIVARLINEAAPWLAPDGVLLIEIDARRAAEVVAAAAAAGWGHTETVKDLVGCDRFVVLRSPAQVASRHRHR